LEKLPLLVVKRRAFSPAILNLLNYPDSESLKLIRTHEVYRFALVFIEINVAKAVLKMNWKCGWHGKSHRYIAKNINQ
jgi:hypothetical protein